MTGPLNFYINLAASSPKNALVRSETNTSPAPMPDLVIADYRDINIYLCDGDGNLDATSGSSAWDVYLSVGRPNRLPESGTFTLTFNSQTTSALAYNSTAAQIQTALRALTSIGAGNCQVSGEFPVWTVEFIGTLANTDCWSGGGITGSGANLLPESGVEVASLQVGGGGYNDQQLIRVLAEPAAKTTFQFDSFDHWQVQLNLNTRGVAELLGEEESVACVVEVETVSPAGQHYTILQADAVLRGEVTWGNSDGSTSMATYYTQAEADDYFVRNRSDITGLTGGTSTDLDGIVTTTKSAGMILAITISGALSFYQLTSGTDAESSPNVIRPDDYAASTNEKVWKLLSVL